MSHTPNLRQQSTRATGTALLGQCGVTVLNLCATILVARILSPEDYGIMAMAGTLIVFAGLFRDLGLSAAVIQRETLSRDELNTAFWLSTLAGVVLAIIVSALAPALAWFFDRPELTRLVPLLSLSFIVAGPAALHGALLQRELKLGRKASADILGAASMLIVSLTLATRGLGYWSLGCGNLAGAIISALMLHLQSSFRPQFLPRSASVAPLLRFGYGVVAFDVVNYFHRNMDSILIGRFADSAQLGAYNRAYQLLMLPIQQFRTPLQAVAYPAMSRLHTNPDEFRAYYRNIVLALALASMPLAGLFFLHADSIIHLLLGPRWLEAAGILKVLAVVAFVQPVSSLRGIVLMSLGLSTRYLQQGILAAGAGVAGFAIGVRWGAEGVAVAYATTTLFVFIPIHLFCFKATPMRLSDVLAPSARPALATIAAGCLSLFAHAHGWMEWARLAVFLGVCLALLTSSRAIRLRMTSVVVSLRPQRPPPA